MRADGDSRRRQKAVELKRRVDEAWAAFEASGRTGGMAVYRLARRTTLAESALFRVACSASDDPAPRSAYGQVARYRSAAQARVAAASGRARRRLIAKASLQAARGVLWAFDLPGLSDPDPARIAQLLEGLDEEPWPETEFALVNGGPGYLFGEGRIASAADARFELAERLATLRPPPATNTWAPEDLDEAFRTRDKFYSTDEALLWSCQLASCHGQDAEGEARILAQEAEFLYRFLGGLGSYFGPDDAEGAERRHDDLLNQLSRSPDGPDGL